MKLLDKIIAAILILGTSACSDYLDVIPDNIATIDMAFSDRVNAEKFLNTCYSYLPAPNSPNYTQGLMSGNECWLGIVENHGQFGSIDAFQIARGYQNADSPILSYWDSGLYIAIRDCNTFLENIHLPGDLKEADRIRWTAEVKFLKAYYHYFLLRAYGPIHIIRENIPVSAKPDEVRLFREPVDEVVDYITSLIDEAAPDLPLEVSNTTQELGRITRPIALAIKAKLLTLAASPLFNGNNYYADMIDKRGKNLFSTTYDVTKWEKAVVALQEAIECAHKARHELYYYTGFNPVSEFTRQTLNIRNAVTERWNKEIIWGSVVNDSHLQRMCAVKVKQNEMYNNSVLSMLSPTLETAERFYSNHGIPLEEDKSWDYANRYTIQTANTDTKYAIKPGYRTIKLHFDREPRFYASVHFDGAVLYGNGIVSDDDPNIGYCQMLKGKPTGIGGLSRNSATGYVVRKLLSVETTVAGENFTTKRYSFPIIRLADLYLLLAEALNETKAVPDQEVYKWIDLVRKRASLEGVTNSWSKYSTNPGKPTTQAGMREIIHRERMIELSFEGEYYWDMIRWKEAETRMNKPVQGWDMLGETSEEFYTLKTFAKPQFTVKNYLTPIKKANIEVNINLLQNYGW